MLVAAVFGVIPFKINKWEFGDTYASFGFQSAPVVKCVFSGAGSIFIGTNIGLAVASSAATNLSAPDPWTVFTEIPGISGPISIKHWQFSKTRWQLLQKAVGFLFKRINRRCWGICGKINNRYKGQRRKIASLEK